MQTEKWTSRFQKISLTFQLLNKEEPKDLQSSLVWLYRAGELSRRLLRFKVAMDEEACQDTSDTTLEKILEAESEMLEAVVKSTLILTIMMQEFEKQKFPSKVLLQCYAEIRRCKEKNISSELIQKEIYTIRNFLAELSSSAIQTEIPKKKAKRKLNGEGSEVESRPPPKTSLPWWYVTDAPGYGEGKKDFKNSSGKSWTQLETEEDSEFNFEIRSDFRRFRN